MKKTFGFIMSSLFALLLVQTISAAPVTRQAAGANAAAIQTAVDQFRADLGGANNGVGSSHQTGRREINWDAVPDTFSSPNNLPFDFFNVNSPRGAIFNSVANIAGDNPFILSADSSNPANSAARFGDIDPSYTNIFQTFSPERLFVARGSNIIEVRFFIPGTKIPATVSGFGAVFSDVDASSNTFIEFFDVSGKQIGESQVPDANNGLSFLGVSFNAGERVAKVVIKLGNAPLAAGNVDGHNGIDVVALDDFIYGEPRAIGHHKSDFDGDGTTDFAVFRPSVGQWFVLNSGNNTFTATVFGGPSDIPVDGDFDGDGRNDIAVYRRATGNWFILQSSNNQLFATQFGTQGDIPVAGDFDKDGKSDVAVWRPSVGTYFFLRSSNGQFGATQWGTNGDIPIGSSLTP